MPTYLSKDPCRRPPPPGGRSYKEGEWHVGSDTAAFQVAYYNPIGSLGDLDPSFQKGLDVSSWSTLVNLSSAEKVNQDLELGYFLANQPNCNWKFGGFKSQTKWNNQMLNRGWTPKDINEALTQGKSYPAPNNINPSNPATRYVHPTTGKSVVIDDVTREIIHIGGPNFEY